MQSPAAGVQDGSRCGAAADASASAPAPAAAAAPAAAGAASRFVRRCAGTRSISARKGTAGKRRVRAPSVYLCPGRDGCGRGGAGSAANPGAAAGATADATAGEAASAAASAAAGAAGGGRAAVSV
eukprot:scaffold61321_cov69-Phaeocystis_antarctica.AAC.2